MMDQGGYFKPISPMVQAETVYARQFEWELWIFKGLAAQSPARTHDGSTMANGFAIAPKSWMVIGTDAIRFVSDEEFRRCYRPVSGNPLAAGWDRVGAGSLRGEIVEGGIDLSAGSVTPAQLEEFVTAVSASLSFVGRWSLGTEPETIDGTAVEMDPYRQQVKMIEAEEDRRAEEYHERFLLERGESKENDEQL